MLPARLVRAGLPHGPRCARSVWPMPVVTVDGRLYRHALRLVPERGDRIYTLDELHRHHHLRPGCRRARRTRAAPRIAATLDILVDAVLFVPGGWQEERGRHPSLALASMSASDRERFPLLHAARGERRDGADRPRERLGQARAPVGGQGRKPSWSSRSAWPTSCWCPALRERGGEVTPLSAWRPWLGRPSSRGTSAAWPRWWWTARQVCCACRRAGPGGDIPRLAAAPDEGARMAGGRPRLRGGGTILIRGRRRPTPRYRRAAAQGDAAPLDDLLAGARPATPPSRPWPSPSVLGFTMDAVTLEQAARWVAVTAGQSPGGHELGSPCRST